MPNFAFNTNLPAAPNNPSDDQPKMLINTNSEFGIWPIDHHGFDDNLGGYHTIIHQDRQTVDPLPIPGPPQINQLYVREVVPQTAPPGPIDTQLFARTAIGGISQLTGNNASPQGYQWLGGLLLQWGKLTFINAAQNSGSVTFLSATSLSFPLSCLNVQATAFYTTTPPIPSNTAQLFVDEASLTNLGFNWAINSVSHGNMKGFYWVAIGF